MDYYKVLWKRSSEKDLRNIEPKQIPRIIKVAESLSENPFPRQNRKLRGSKDNYRIRVGNYRVIYQVDKRMKIVTIYHICHRREIYRK